MDVKQEEGSVYQVNIYWGIHAPSGEAVRICEALAGSKFAPLAGEEREMHANGKLIMRNMNSDFEESRVVIFPDDMSVQGEESTAPTTYCKFDPAELTEREETHKDCVEFITDMYDLIIAHYKKSRLSFKRFHLGWAAYNCEWADDESESDEPAPKPAAPKPAASKKPVGKGKK